MSKSDHPCALRSFRNTFAAASEKSLCGIMYTGSFDFKRDLTPCESYLDGMTSERRIEVQNCWPSKE